MPFSNAPARQQQLLHMPFSYASPLAGDNFQPGRNPFFQLRHVADDTYQATAFLKRRQSRDGSIQSFRIQRTETFVHQDCIQT